MIKNSGDSSKAVYAVKNKNIKLNTKSNTRKYHRRMRQRRRRLHQLMMGLIGVIIAFIAVSTVVYYVQMTELKGEVEEKKAALAQLESEAVSLTAQKENAVDLSYVEEYAENTLGLVNMDRSQEEYLELQKTDQVEVNEASSGVDKLVSGFVKSFNAILSFLR